jgi:hypothetical protein
MFFLVSNQARGLRAAAKGQSLNFVMPPLAPFFDRLSRGLRACTHKSRLSDNRWLMSALPPKAEIKRGGSHVRLVP